MDYKYFPVLRARQQELDVLEKFDFEDKIVPIIEIIKEKARSNQKSDGHDDYAELIESIKSQKVLVDLPIYLDPTLSTANEVRKFFLSTISNLDERIRYLRNFTDLSNKVIPVISILQPHSDEADTLIRQFTELSPLFPQVAIRIYINKFEESIAELQRIELRADDLIIYDLDTTDITNPLAKIQKRRLDILFSDIFKVVIRSAINTDIQNVKLQHGDIIPEANNSLLELYNSPQYKFHAFGDFSGVKKDDITSGGSISPGFIFFNPEENLFYGFRGITKSLEEFGKTIVPAVLNLPVVRGWVASDSPFIVGNPGYTRLLSIQGKAEPSKSQAKFKWIAIMHYLHCIKQMIKSGAIS